MALNNLWNLYNLRESPYFQNDLQPSGQSSYPVEQLFVGREREVQRILNTVVGARSSRQTLEGFPGHGKTSLAQFVKSALAAEGYLSYPEPVSVAGVDTADTLLVRILSYVYDALASQAGTELLEAPAVEEARRLLFDTRTRDTRVVVNLAGSGFDRETRSQMEPAAFHVPLLQVPRLLRALPRVVQEAGYRAIVVHMNNLENLLTDRDRKEASNALRDLRDLFLLEGYHYLLVGTPEAVRELISPHAQLRSVFGVSNALGPLSSDGFQQLLARRYGYLRADPRAEVRPPVAHDATAALYALYGGDLRGTLRTLESAARELIGLTEPPGAPISLEQLRTVIRPLLDAEAHASLGETLLDYLCRLSALDQPEFTQSDLVRHWELTQGTVSQNLRELQSRGYVREVRREGRKIWYALSGTARLLLGLEG